MESINYQEEYRKLFLAYRANSDTPDLTARQKMKALIDKFPYCQSLQFIYVSGLKNNLQKFESNLPKISLLAPQREILYQIIHYPEHIIFKGNIIPPAKEDIINKENSEPASKDTTEADEQNTDRFLEKSIMGSDSMTQTDSQRENLHGNPDSEPKEQNQSLETSEEKLSPVSQEEPAENSIARDKLVPEDLIPDNIASHDYFIFDKSAIDHTEGFHEAGEKGDEFNSVPKSSAGLNQESRKISRYHDDKMPFTFLWWLNKTRKQHADTYQPYVNFSLDVTMPIRRSPHDELNQQIIQNIFHLQTPIEDKENNTKSTTIEFKVKSKDEELIEKFIKQEPQIKPMQPENISTENKARKSAEDVDDLVSETLANIYIEQMMFHKAIDTYKKLSLKFPKKSAYFADQISDLEKRIS